MAHAYHEHLKAVPLFADLGEHELDVVAKATTELDLKAGYALITEGQWAHEMFVVVCGSLEVTRDGAHVADIGRHHRKPAGHTDPGFWATGESPFAAPRNLRSSR